MYWRFGATCAGRPEYHRAAQCAQNTVLAVLLTLSTAGSYLSGENNALPFLKWGTAWAEAAITCCQVAVPPPVRLVLNAFEAAASVHDGIADCTPVFAAAYQGVLDVIAVYSYDPNASRVLRALAPCNICRAPRLGRILYPLKMTQPLQLQLNLSRLPINWTRPTWTLDHIFAGSNRVGNQEIVAAPRAFPILFLCRFETGYEFDRGG